MLVLHRSTGTWEDRTFRDLPDFLTSGDCLVLNDTRVFASRLFGRKPGLERQVELFLLRPESEDRRKWSALARPGRHLRTGTRIHLSPQLSADILEARHRGERLVEFICAGDLDAELEAVGHIPLPPYIRRKDQAADRERYQTVYADKRGSVAAPTAGLHFTPEVLTRCEQAGADIARVTLHVGLGTFQPLHSDLIQENQLHSERFDIGPGAALKLAAAKRRVAVGTTSVRTLETAVARAGWTAQSGETDIFIYPGYEFRAVDAMVTNFHLPKSSLMLLVSAFAGAELALAAYRHAVEARYRFFSYGDCMLIL
jgi:S-adenosylmethionine:tRNA ribosyltransferase-isomerase